MINPNTEERQEIQGIQEARVESINPIGIELKIESLETFGEIEVLIDSGKIPRKTLLHLKKWRKRYGYTCTVCYMKEEI